CEDRILGSRVRAPADGKGRRAVPAASDSAHPGRSRRALLPPGAIDSSRRKGKGGIGSRRARGSDEPPRPGGGGSKRVRADELRGSVFSSGLGKAHRLDPGRRQIMHPNSWIFLLGVCRAAAASVCVSTLGFYVWATYLAGRF